MQTKPTQQTSLSCCSFPLSGAARRQWCYQDTQGAPSHPKGPAQWCWDADRLQQVVMEQKQAKRGHNSAAER